MEDWEEESPSDDDDDKTEIENELYSMFYYHSMSDGLPEDLSQKYRMDTDSFGVVISLNDTSPDERTSLKKSSDDSILECEITYTDERYVDRAKGNREIVSKTSDDNCDIYQPISKKLLVQKNSNESSDGIPRQRPITKFQSIRYYSEESKSYHRTDYPGHNLDNSSNKNIFHKNKNVITSTPICQKNVNNNKNVTTSTPVCQKNVNKVLINTKKTQPKKVIVNSKDKIDLIDLTLEPSKKQGKPKSKTKIEKKRTIVPVITISSDSDSDSESEEESISSDSDSDCDEQMFDSIMLNTSIPVDKNVCDISEINLDYDWKNTSSPEGWSRSMRKFYNKPSISLLNFDYQNIIEKMREQGEGEWSICKADLLRVKSSRRIRCLRCNQEGHVKARCTKIFSCHMCGTPGHNFKKCPNNICLKCGSKCREIFPSSCAKCFNDEKMTCSRCGVAGHSSKLCTAAWHSITSNEGNGNNSTSITKYCCNCGKSGHRFEDCKRPHFSSYLSGNEVNTSKTSRLKDLNFKKRNHFKDKNVHSMNSQGTRFKSKARIHSRVLKSKSNFNHDSFNLRPSLKNAKKRHVSKRIQMLRNSKKNNKNKTTLSHIM